MGAGLARDAAPQAELVDVPALTGDLRLARLPRREATYVLLLPNNFRRAAPQAAQLFARLDEDFRASGARSRAIAVLPTDAGSPFEQVGAAQLQAEFTELFPLHARDALLLAKDDLRRPRTDLARYVRAHVLQPPPATPFQLYRLDRCERAFIPDRPAEPCPCFHRLAEL